MQGQKTTFVIFSDQLGQLMDHSGVKQAELASALEVSQAAVSKWTRGAVPGGLELLKLSRHFDVTMEYLLTGEDRAGGPAPPVPSAPRVCRQAAEGLADIRARIAEIEKNLRSI